MTTEIQIYCRRPALGEMICLIEMGVELLGWDLRPADGDAVVQTRHLVQEIQRRGRRATVLVHSRRLRTLQTLGEMLKPNYLLLSADRDESHLPHLDAALREFGVHLMVPIPVGTPGSSDAIPSVELAARYQPFAGYFTVDTCPDIQHLNGFGCTGQVNDWEVAAKVVSSVSTPVIMAGGLNTRNVGAAIRAVRPRGVDACTSLELADRSKDLSECEAFVAMVRKTDKEFGG